jgi:hypothetical protein
MEVPEIQTPMNPGASSVEIARVKSTILAVLSDPDVRDAVLQQLIDSSTAAKIAAPWSWDAALSDDGFRVNVGEVEVLVLSGGTVLLSLLGQNGTAPFKGDLFVDVEYQSVAEVSCAFVGSPQEFMIKRLELLRAHLRFVDRAGKAQFGERRKGTPFCRNHSEALIAYAKGEMRKFRLDVQGGGKEVDRRCVASKPRAIAAPTTVEGSAVLTEHPFAAEVDGELAILRQANLTVTEKEQLIIARRGQGRFRENVLRVEPKCRLTGVTDPDHLIASHIKPWKDSTNEERLSGDNGLMLGPHVDHLFDNGYIGFTDVGDLLVSPRCPAAVLQAWGISDAINVGPFRLVQRSYLKFHRQMFKFEA